MTLEQINQYLAFVIFTYNDVNITVAKVIQVPLILFAMWFVVTRIGKLIKKTLLAKKISQDAVHLFTRIYFILSIAILIFTSLEVLSIPLTAFAFVSGAIAIGVGFGAQNIINNFISGWILMWERPIRIGDFLEVGNAKGVVETINTRSTRIRRNDGVHMLIPNSQLLENTVTNWTLIDGNARSSVSVGVAYGSDVILVKKLIQQVLDDHDAILVNPKSSVLFDDFADSSLVFNAIFWVCAESETMLRKVRSDIRFSIYAVFEEHDVVIAFPQRDIHIDGEIAFKRS
ncbi:mechanosensitive ion channel [Pseudoalteromonas sp. SR43-6]|jgi:small-conductance mechanosensitive channel|uniref:Mechanosensitive ion channel n=2 Tax=Pseudoalteromonas TaxID=53246 RepID=A0ABT9GHY8_9GAMM|nr:MULTISPECIES: mechanosensitive ion channel domain-containing protein [Pseudoalteromonas]EGI74903.1 potassium efflux system KefA protein / small-conductance mechanosensitive channel [Pseudoalteromonas distincta]KAA1159130.1 mechanosensitive ion channel [Pseudoalteromonas distincta]KHM44468.1 mechanosensitive ion channel protein [Pseudoalteromonas elyakovii]KID39785.1 mechanosensitive ion channel protein [Pseudoalteromonas distincta]MBB1280681.1 mechanosensitive ion channel [Pseudoalteromonas|tara:strand:- start:1105 stop:1965 length:861 start_codon:yes stop_codon:yes gene_type:complete